jgi:hypothetical protein
MIKPAVLNNKGIVATIAVVSATVLAGFVFYRWHRTSSSTESYIGGSASLRDSSRSKSTDINILNQNIPLFSDGWHDRLGDGIQFELAEPDPRNLIESQRVRGQRGERRLEVFRRYLQSISKDDPRTLREWREVNNAVARILLDTGDFIGAAKVLRELQSTYPESSYLYANYEAALGVAAMRRGEVENCVSCQNEASCVFPLATAAVHQKKAGSREAIEHFSNYLEKRPEDTGVRWLLNVVYMTLGEYPDRVPEKWLIKLDAFGSSGAASRFVNVAARTGIDVLGPRYAGGSAFDDFNGDGLLDLVVSTEDPTVGGSILINRGDGTFEDKTAGSGLENQPGSLNIKHTDFDNDGNLDVLFLRGAWETPQRMSLMRNKGNGVFEDVTVSAGLDRPISSASAGWADYDNDGFLDLYLAGETKSPINPNQLYDIIDLPNSSRLYHNNGNGTFTDVAEAAGVKNNHYGKGVAWGDYDGDGAIDLFVANFDSRSRLFHNKGDGTFEEPGGKFMPKGSWTAFGCWFWDYDNDGDLDLFVNSFNATFLQTVESMLGRKVEAQSPRLFRNEGAEGFKEVAAEVGLDRVLLAMGCNYGDIDNDGYLDIYEGTGKNEYAYLIPNVMLKNDRGGRFVDVTLATGTGHLQKGHGVSFGDWNNDGYADLFVRAGGATRGDQANAVLFQNPGGTNHWIYVKLIGKKTNRAAIGAAVRITLEDEPGYPSPNIRYRVVSAGSSWGGNGFPMTIGLGAARTIKSLEVIWPTSKTKQTFKDVKIDQSITITEFADRYETLDRKPIAVPKNDESR